MGSYIITSPELPTSRQRESVMNKPKLKCRALVPYTVITLHLVDHNSPVPGSAQLPCPSQVNCGNGLLYHIYLPY